MNMTLYLSIFVVLRLELIWGPFTWMGRAVTQVIVSTCHARLGSDGRGTKYIRLRVDYFMRGSIIDSAICCRTQFGLQLSFANVKISQCSKWCWTSIVKMTRLIKIVLRYYVFNWSMMLFLTTNLDHRKLLIGTLLQILDVSCPLGPFDWSPYYKNT